MMSCRVSSFGGGPGVCLSADPGDFVKLLTADWEVGLVGELALILVLDGETWLLLVAEAGCLFCKDEDVVFLGGDFEVLLLVGETVDFIFL